MTNIKSRYETVVISCSYSRFNGNMHHFRFITAPLRSVTVTAKFTTSESLCLKSQKITESNYILSVTTNAKIL